MRHSGSIPENKDNQQEHLDIGPSAYFAKLGKKKVNEDDHNLVK